MEVIRKKIEERGKGEKEMKMRIKIEKDGVEKVEEMK